MKKKWIAALVAVVVVGGLAWLLSQTTKKEPVDGYKEVHVTIVDQDGKTVLDENFETNAPTLTKFLESTPKLKATMEQGEYGSLLTEIYGLKQDMEKGPWLVYESETNTSCKEAGGYCPAMDDVTLDASDAFTFKQITSFE
ncbi:hypothetical protein [uncultured Dubosiella sp.]|uniref:hypothetical protein n=1 Tax=uncultured Dubosiella sp. TaxID=1937011 RepID=UPI0025B48313|nr:hypothetical protein [uncultured Dubosiella sp.]